MRFCVILLLVIIPICGYTQLNIPDKGAIISMSISDINTGNDIVSLNSQTRLIPASLTKIITTATALELLGPEYTFKTQIIGKGEIVDGQLKGDIVVIAGGDPTLGSRYFDQTEPELLFKEIIEWLRIEGIHSIRGRILVKSADIGYSSPRLWEDIGNYYGVYPQAFNWRDNTVTVTLASEDVGSVCNIVSVKPEIFPYQYDCKVESASHSKDSAYVYGLPEIKKWWIEGSIPSNRSSFKIKAAMPDTKLVFVNELTQYLTENNIVIQQVNFGEDEIAKSRIVFDCKSPKLSEIIKVVNHKSHNLFADVLLLSLAKEYKDQYSWDIGVQIIRDFWKDKIDFESNFRLRDGSGLTPKNLVTTDGMVHLLMWMKNNSSYYDVFKSSLAIGGQTGTLKSVFKNPELRNKVFGKSGSMEGVLGYCGYFINKSGHYEAFCVIANNYLIKTKEVRKQMDETLTNYFLEY
ncbi:D-alanyl-D-alanine carboxypeptidase/D-alanyl-D-alanine endopeptidase [Plebeiibacterium sediminum]|uniref:D-alanyl-D-alanine carboxypeptidase/D-alanyl-D-alanine-endopeptidase n=1 Tax=Plebeiibacterium sediminum TaxID=2992112 RepID=A0AAE3M4U0_9BACT|nr:D-alanyl-D-alanine carboxypeptidase/D-alanyl-D-alanine-endopeptidase [Plebeiobacterium sediminum]MCW3787073.1 D-alanyl-D-alanine carboxypeptidase/D-alanyl-D-alanine-endopeptidase [Plebeiobacterium sediminum]